MKHSKRKSRCVQCGREIFGEIRCASCKAKNKHHSPDQKRRR